MKVKICGLTEVENAVEVAELGVDYLGLNFFPKSKRFIAQSKALEIVSALPSKAKVVGLFVDAELSVVQRCVEELSLDVVQLHGDENLNFVRSLNGVEVWKAVRLKDQKSVQQAVSFSSEVSRLVLDAFVDGEYGGTGAMVDKVLLESCSEILPNSFIAGGLSASNVQEIVATYSPYGVDVASGVEFDAVESAPGLKDIQLVSKFVQKANNT